MGTNDVSHSCGPQGMVPELGSIRVIERLSEQVNGVKEGRKEKSPSLGSLVM